MFCMYRLAFLRFVSSNVNEVIRIISCLFHEKILHAEKAQKAQKAQKANKRLSLRCFLHA